MIREFFFKSFLKEDEQVLLVIHRHMITAFPEFFRVVLFGLLIPAVVYWLFPQTLIFTAVWAWLGVMRFIYSFFDWYYDSLLVTNVSILQIVWEGFFSKSAERTEYHHVESIAYEIKGFWPTILNHGTIVIEKETGNLITFEKAVSPKKKVEKMLAFHEYFIAQKNLRDHKTLKGLMTDLLSHHFKEHMFTKQKKS